MLIYAIMMNNVDGVYSDLKYLIKVRYLISHRCCSHTLGGRRKQAREGNRIKFSQEDLVVISDIMDLLFLLLLVFVILLLSFLIC